MPNGPSAPGKASAGERLPAAMGFGGPLPAPSRNAGAAPSRVGLPGSERAIATAPRAFDERTLTFAHPRGKVNRQSVLLFSRATNHDRRVNQEAFPPSLSRLPASSLASGPTNGGHNGQRAGEG